MGICRRKGKQLGTYRNPTIVICTSASYQLTSICKYLLEDTRTGRYLSMAGQLTIKVLKRAQESNSASFFISFTQMRLCSGRVGNAPASYSDSGNMIYLQTYLNSREMVHLDFYLYPYLCLRYMGLPDTYSEL